MAELKNARQEKFAQLVAGGKPQGGSYIEAGYSVKGKDQEKQANALGARLAANDRVSARIAELRAAATAVAVERLNVQTTDIVRLLYDRATFDPASILGWRTIQKGKQKGHRVFVVKDLDDVPLAARRQIKTVRFTGDEVLLTFHDSMPAVRLLGEHMGMFQGESAPPAGGTIINDNRQQVFVDAPKPESVEEWQARVMKRLAAAGNAALDRMEGKA